MELFWIFYSMIYNNSFRLVADYLRVLTMSKRKLIKSTGRQKYVYEAFCWIQWGLVIQTLLNQPTTVELGYNDHGYNEQNQTLGLV